MIERVSFKGTTYNQLPYKFEAGTPAIGEAVGMGAAIRYLQTIGLDAIQAWEAQLTRYLFERLQAIDGVKILGPTPEQQPERGALATFLVDGVHANDIAELIDASGICIRSGHHCCQPLHRHYGVTASARASLSFTSTFEEIDRFSDELASTVAFLREHS